MDIRTCMTVLAISIKQQGQKGCLGLSILRVNIRLVLEFVLGLVSEYTKFESSGYIQEAYVFISLDYRTLDM